MIGKRDLLPPQDSALAWTLEEIDVVPRLAQIERGIDEFLHIRVVASVEKEGTLAFSLRFCVDHREIPLFVRDGIQREDPGTEPLEWNS